jgi:penicillin-binding protein 2
MTDPFRWQADGDGLRVRRATHGMVQHEVMYEDDITHIKERPLYMGASIPNVRFFVVFGVVACMLTGLLGRSFWMQIMHGAEYRERADRNRLRQEVVLPRRGIIRDRSGNILAENVPSFDVRLIERQLPSEKTERDELLGRIGRTLGMRVGEIEGLMASSTDPDDSLVIKRDVPYDRAIAMKIVASSAAGIDVAVGSKRRYPYSAETTSLSHVLGYVSGITRDELERRRAEGYRQIDLLGKTGIESTYESILRGKTGERLYEVDSRHQVTALVGETPSVDGSDVTLSIDLRLQRAAEAALRAEMTKAGVARGAVVAMDPRDGSILAIASLPAYDNNLFSGTVSSTAYAELISNPDHPLLPRAWAGTYPSGSTAKPMLSIAALAEGIITPKTTVLSTGGLHVGPWFFPDWKAGGHGLVNVRSAIAWSVNTFFYYIGGGYDRFVGLGVDKISEWMKKFGLGEKTGIDVPGEAVGFVPTREWKETTKSERWFIGDTYNLSIGQGDLLVTPLQVASWTATIANGGYVVQPKIGMKYGRPEDVSTVVSTTRATDPIASGSVVETVRLGMRDNVTYGSGRALSDLPFAAAGKTGTAQWRADKENHAWFTSFAPFEKPEVVVTVLLEEGKEGSSTAVPVAKEILKAWWATRGR